MLDLRAEMGLRHLQGSAALAYQPISWPYLFSFSNALLTRRGGVIAWSGRDAAATLPPTDLLSPALRPE